MSVINQVLKDLDKRQQTANGARVRSHYQPAVSRPWLWIATLSAGIVFSAVVTWWLVAHAMSASERPMAELQGKGAAYENPELALEVMQLQASDPSANTSEQPHKPVEKADKPVAISSEPEAAREPTSRSSDDDARSVQVLPVAVANTANGTGSTSAASSSQVEATETEQLEAPEQEESRGEMRVQRVERNAAELAAQRLEQAVGAMESGEGRKAESLLQEALVLAPQFVDARQQLAAYYYGRGFTSEALRVLREGLAHTPGNSRLLTLSARIYEESGRADEALAMLNRLDADLPRQNDIVVLRAALANELGQYQIAADDYRDLLAVNPNQGIWWLGLGVAEEGRANYEAARLAYQRAGEDRGLDRASREYALSREEALAVW